ncbi:MAG: lysine transporter LysE [Chlorobium sp.]|nr:MAG: lysine transporter LysE [Chlorobium sp.]
MMIFTYLILGAAYGFAAALQPGPFQTYMISETVRNGWKRTLPVIFAPLLSDGPIIIMVLLVLSRVPAWWLILLRFSGGIFILFLAAGLLKAWMKSDLKHDATASGIQYNILRAALVNFLNPSPYLYWSLVTGPWLIKGWHESPVYGVSFLAGFYCILLLTLAGLLFVFASVDRMGSRVQRALLGISGLMLASLGLYQIWEGALMMMHRQ